MRILHAVTVPVTVQAFLRGQLADLADAGHEVHLVCSPGEVLERLDPRVTVHPVPMSREPALLQDLRSLRAATAVLREVRPDVTVVGTPKAGLVVGLAAWLVRVPRRYYLLRGLRLQTARGPARALLTVLEVLSCAVAHRVVAVSPSLAEEVRRLPLVRDSRVVVVGSGSSNGVDTTRFRPGRQEDRLRRRRELGIAEDEVVLGFVGRLGPDKGLAELLRTAEDVGPRARLVVVGQLENAPPGTGERLERLGATVTGFVEDTADWYPALDALVLPTYREGFPNVALEAAASGLPVVTTTATGARDAVVDGVTGLLVPPRDAEALTAACLRLAGDPALRQALGESGRSRVLREFQQQEVWRCYRRLWESSSFVPV